jgi:hypothetical protein
MEKVGDLFEPFIDPDDRGAALIEQIFPQPALPVHLDEEPAELAERDTARPFERASLATQETGVGAAWSHSCRPAEKRRHAKRV